MESGRRAELRRTAYDDFGHTGTLYSWTGEHFMTTSSVNPHRRAPSTHLPPLQGGGNHRGAWVIFMSLLGVASCGVQDHPHPQASYDPNHDLGPIGPPTTVGGATTGGSATTGSSTTTSSTTRSATTTGNPPADAQGGGTGGAPNDNPRDASSDGVLPPPVRDANVEPPPSSGVVTNIGGVNVPKENIIAFIHLGHSNMAGRATGPASEAPYNLTQTDPHAWMYHVGTAMQPALEPRTAGDNGCTSCGGPGTPLLKQAAAMAPGKYFVSLGYGIGSAYCTQFLPGALYYDALIAAPKAMKGRCIFGGIVIMLGITERHGTSADITGYSSCINQLVTAIRNDVGEPNLPLLITDYEANATGALATNQAFPQSIIPEIRKIPNVVSNSALVPTDALSMQDDHHFNYLGHKVWTGRVLQIMKDKGWFPWGP
jgi:hypothetical protein